MKKLNKDFYDRLPAMVCEILEAFIENYGNAYWFKDAWEEYRKHVLNTYWENVKMPSYVFNKYLDGDK